MTLREELEILRGNSIEAFTGDPRDIPCIETSDAEKLCKHPVVSVHMITYNHEPYIRQAIEGVMMQKTDFDYELVIGEDASTDKTREICFEYQKRYPDRIRVLWWHENVAKMGGNSNRCKARCRGEFIAFCEGDDYWIDPLKLQKQVVYLRATGAIGCVANNRVLAENKMTDYFPMEYKPMLSFEDVRRHYFHTSTYMISAKVYWEMVKRYSLIPKWYDYVLLNCMASMGKIGYLSDFVSVYRMTGTGIYTGIQNVGKVKINLTQYESLFRYGPMVGRKLYARSVVNNLMKLLFEYSDSLSGAEKFACSIEVLLIMIKSFPDFRMARSVFSSLAKTILKGRGM